MNEYEEKILGLKIGETVFDGRMYYVTRVFGGFVYTNGTSSCFVPYTEAEPKTEKSEVNKVVKK